MKSTKKKGRKERKLQSLAESPVGTSMRGIQLETERFSFYLFRIVWRRSKKVRAKREKKLDSFLFMKGKTVTL